MEWMLMPLKRYADFSGRSRRMEFWMWQVFKFLVMFVFWIVFFALAGSAAMSGDPSALIAVGGIAMILWLVMMLFFLAILIPDIAVAVRRLHDTNRTGWWVLAPLAPYLLVILGGVMAATNPDAPGLGGVLAVVGMVGAIGLVLTLLVFYFLEGTRGPNKYGPDPKGQQTDQVFA